MRNILFDAVKNFRYERKFLIDGGSRQEIETALRVHPALFSRIFHPRFINNIYFDSFAMAAYSDAVSGHMNRAKLRIRWYGDLFGPVERPVLEIKIKQGMVGRKESYPLKGFALDRDFDADTAGAEGRDPNADAL